MLQNWSMANLNIVRAGFDLGEEDKFYYLVNSTTRRSLNRSNFFAHTVRAIDICKHQVCVDQGSIANYSLKVNLAIRLRNTDDTVSRCSNTVGVCGSVSSFNVMAAKKR